MAYDLTDIVFNIKPFTVVKGDDKLSLTCADKFVLLALAHHADRETHECWPKQGSLASTTSLSRDQVIDSVKKLNRLEVFKTIDSKKGKNNIYTLDVTRLKELVALSNEEGNEKAKRKYERSGKYAKDRVRREPDLCPKCHIPEADCDCPLDRRPIFNIEGDDDDLA